MSRPRWTFQHCRTCGQSMEGYPLKRYTCDPCQAETARLDRLYKNWYMHTHRRANNRAVRKYYLTHHPEATP
jgi:hypothetical protein